MAIKLIKKIFLDTETTGVSRAKHELYMIGCIIEIDGIEKERFELYARPRHIETADAEALRKCNTTKEKLLSYPDPMETYKKFISILGKYINKFDRSDKFHMYGFYVSHDDKFLRKFFEEAEDKYYGSWFFVPVIDVASLAAERVQLIRPMMKNFKQSEVAKTIGISVKDDNLHSALYDAELAMKIYKWTQESKSIVSKGGNEKNDKRK